MEVEYFTLDNCKWEYKGEGNAHLAISLPKDQMVLRFEKVPQDIPIDDRHPTKLQLELDFILNVMTKLLGRNFVPVPQIVNMQKKEVENINKILQNVRPDSRLHKKIGSCSASLWPDVCFLSSNLSNTTAPTFSVEIKPKQGIFAPHDQGAQQCLFCLKQDLKLKQHSVHERSCYCPLDLFSGDKEKMMTALKGLLHTPQNNLKIYKDGKLMYGPDGLTASLEDVLSEWLQPLNGFCLESRICEILFDVLTRKLDVDNESTKDELVWQNDGPPLLCRLANSAMMRSNSTDSERVRPNGRRQCYWGKQNLPSGCVLEKLSGVQSLGVCGEAAAYELYKQEVNQGADDYTYVKSIFDAGCSSALSPLQGYLLSALARDCSIMIAFQRAQDLSRQVSLPVPVVTDPATGASYVFQIRFMDVDPKPLSVVANHHKRNCQILQASKQSSN